MNDDEDDSYLAQGALDVEEAERILPRLEKEGIRFEIETDTSAHAGGNAGVFSDSRIQLFIHQDDLPTWEKSGMTISLYKHS